ncbi:ATP-binding protein, partial [Methanosarcinales archaeon]
LEIFKKKDLYFFVNKDSLSFHLLKEYEEIFKSKGVLKELESLKNWEDFVKVLFERVKGMIVFDEFQNFREVEPSIYGLFQKYIDLNEAKEGLFLVFLGSNIGLIKRIFEDKKSPLYGRIKRKLMLKPLDFKDIIEFCHHLKIKDIEEIIILYSIFGGYPKYYVSIEDEQLQGAKVMAILNRFFLDENALLEDEVANILSLEFGKRKGAYYDILSAVALGNTQLKDIASSLRRKQTSMSRQFNELQYYFDIIDYKIQFFGKRKIYFIKHPLIKFWFRFFYKNLSYYNQRLPLFFENFRKQFNGFLGERFEEICKEVLKDMNSKMYTPFFMEKIGKHWGYLRESKERRSYEIDIVGVNEKEKKILLGECKWKERVNPKRILRELKDKISLIDWHSKRREDFFLIFAKSFAFKVNEVVGMDLKEIMNFYKKENFGYTSTR